MTWMIEKSSMIKGKSKFKILDHIFLFKHLAKNFYFKIFFDTKLNSNSNLKH